MSSKAKRKSTYKNNNKNNETIDDYHTNTMSNEHLLLNFIDNNTEDINTDHDFNSHGLISPAQFAHDNNNNNFTNNNLIDNYLLPNNDDNYNTITNNNGSQLTQSALNNNTKKVRLTTYSKTALSFPTKAECISYYSIEYGQKLNKRLFRDKSCHGSGKWKYEKLKCKSCTDFSCTLTRKVSTTRSLSI